APGTARHERTFSRLRTARRSFLAPEKSQMGRSCIPADSRRSGALPAWHFGCSWSDRPTVEPFTPLREVAYVRAKLVIAVIAAIVVLGTFQLLQAQFRARDPGVRGGAAGAGGALAGLSARQLQFFTTGQGDFEEVENVPDGLGPRFNLDSCEGC